MLRTVELWYRTREMRQARLIPGFCRVIGHGIAKCHDCEQSKLCDVIELDADYCRDNTPQYVTLCIDCSRIRGELMKEGLKSSWKVVD